MPIQVTLNFNYELPSICWLGCQKFLLLLTNSICLIWEDEHSSKEFCFWVKYLLAPFGLTILFFAPLMSIRITNGTWVIDKN